VSESIDSRLGSRLGVGGVGDIELDGQEVIVVAQGRRDLLGLRAVATSALPAANAALAMTTPMPRPAPVTNQTFWSVMRWTSLWSIRR
jgi:hypothetical protein